MKAEQIQNIQPDQMVRLRVGKVSTQLAKVVGRSPSGKIMVEKKIHRCSGNWTKPICVHDSEILSIITEQKETP